MRPKRTTYLLLGLAILFVIAIIVLCLLPTERKPEHKYYGLKGSRITATEQPTTLRETTTVSHTTTSPSSSSEWYDWTDTTSTLSSTSSSSSTDWDDTTSTTSTDSLTTSESSSTTEYTTETIDSTTMATTTTHAPVTQTSTPTTSTSSTSTTTTHRTHPTTTPKTTRPTTTSSPPPPRPQTTTHHTTTTTTQSTTTTTHPTTTTTTYPTTATTHLTTIPRTTTTTSIPKTTTTTTSTTTFTPTPKTTTTKTSTTTFTPTPQTTTTKTSTTTFTPTPQTTTTKTSTTTFTPTPQTTTTKTSTTTSTPQTTTTSTPPTTSAIYEDVFEFHLQEKDDGYCATDDCKKIASRMMDSIDHSADFCEDFYQYTCGGVEDDPFLSPEDPHYSLDSLLKDELLKSKNEASEFFETCKKALVMPEKENTLKREADVIETGGVNSTINFTNDETEDFLALSPTQLLSSFIRKDLALFFDVTVEPTTDQDPVYVPRISLPLFDYSLSKKTDNAFCLGSFHSKMLTLRTSHHLTVNLNTEYENYKNCMIFPGVKARVDNVRETWEKLGLTALLSDDNENVFQDLSAFLEEYRNLTNSFDIWSSKQSLEFGQFQALTLEQLDEDAELNVFINWTNFLAEAGLKLDSRREIRVYHRQHLSAIFQFLQGWDQLTLRNILLLLWVENFHSDFDVPYETTSSYCFRATKRFMPLQMQQLFINHFPHLSLARIQAQVHEIGQKVVSQLTETAAKNRKIAFNGSELNGTIVRIENIDRYFLHNKIKYNNKYFTLTNDHVTNVLRLREMLRKNMYDLLLNTHVTIQDSIFLYRIPDPHNHSPRFIKNKLLVPVDYLVPPSLYFDRRIPHYLKFAGVTRYIVTSLLRKIVTSGQSIAESGSMDCMKSEASEELSLKNRFDMDASFKLPKVNSEELESEYLSVALTWEILQNIASSHNLSKNEVPIIWWGSTPLTPVKAYFIKTAQMHCSASSDFKLLETMEDKRMPSRLRVNLQLKHEPLFAKVFNCSEWAKMHSQHSVCSPPAVDPGFPPVHHFPPLYEDYPEDDKIPQNHPEY